MRRFRTRRDIDHKFKALQEIAVELIRATTQHDLLRLIVDKAVDLLECDGGSLYLLSGEGQLTFEVAVNRSVTFDFERTQIPVDGASVASYVFRTATGVRVKDVYDLPEPSPFRFDPSFDKRCGYRTSTMLALPLGSSKGERLGVLQLINRRNDGDDSPWPVGDEAKIASLPEFSDDDESLLTSFAAVASASIEKSNLYRDIENLLQGIIRASVHAIESRDPVTSGHSERVAVLTVDLAEKVSASRDADVRDIRFTPKQLQELQYASLLHDFGKISVHESVLLKPKKLFEEELLRIRARVDQFGHAAEIRLVWELLHKLAKEGRSPGDLDVARLQKSIGEERNRIEGLWKIIADLNEPTVLDENKSHQLDTLKSVVLPLPDGKDLPLLREEEARRLSIKRGSLSEEERLTIENHVTSTYRFLKEIPWTEDYRGVPEIAYAHHEKLTGNGYPRRLKAEAIPVQSRLMTICDIYDALVAADRPYKKAVPIEKALAILESDAKSGALDQRLLRVFLEAKVYDHPEFLRLNQAKQAA